MKKILLPVITALLFSFVWIAGKYLADTIPPITMTFLRYCFAVMIFLPITIYHRHTIRKFTMSDWFYLVLAGGLAVVAYHTLFYWALHFSSPTTLTLIHATNPLLTLLLAYCLLKHSITKSAVIGFCVAVIGVVIVVSDGETISLRLDQGEWLMLTATLAWALFTIVTKHLAVRKIPSLVFTAVISVIGWVMLLPMTLWDVDVLFFQSLSTSTWLALAYMGIGSSGIGYWLYARSVGNIGPAFTSFVVMSLVPLAVAIEEWIWLDTRIQWPLVLGFGFILAGLAIGTLKLRKT